MTCLKCGAENPTTNKYCVRCEMPLPNSGVGGTLTTGKPAAGGAPEASAGAAPPPPGPTAPIAPGKVKGRAALQQTLLGMAPRIAPAGSPAPAAPAPLPAAPKPPPRAEGTCSRRRGGSQSWPASARPGEPHSDRNSPAGAIRRCCAPQSRRKKRRPQRDTKRGAPAGARDGSARWATCI